MAFLREMNSKSSHQIQIDQISGPSFSGKTTLLNVVNNDFDPIITISMTQVQDLVNDPDEFSHFIEFAKAANAYKVWIADYNQKDHNLKQNLIQFLQKTNQIIGSGKFNHFIIDGTIEPDNFVLGINDTKINHYVIPTNNNFMDEMIDNPEVSYHNPSFRNLLFKY